MNTPYITAILAITALSFSTAATAESMSKSEYVAAEKKISSDYKSAIKNCDAFAQNEKGICMADAKRTEKMAKAQLKASYKPSSYATYEASVYKANTEYLIAEEKCNSMEATAKEACVTDSKTYYDQ
jgi:hypothetical protein